MAHKAARLETQEFLDRFFPLPADKSQDDCPQWQNDVFQELKGAENFTEAEVSKYFIEALASVTNLMPTLRLSESQNSPDEGDSSKLRVDAGFFRPGFVPNDGRPHWADQIIPIEFKSAKQRNDPYDDRPKAVFESNADKRKEVRGQLIDYAEQVFRYQQRTELYMLLIMGERFRFLRWDRSGTIVTPAVDYYKDPSTLLEMLWRMSLLKDALLGLDPSAERILPNDVAYEQMDAAAVPQASDVDHAADRKLAEDEAISDNIVFKYVREAFRESLAPEWPRYRLEVPDGNTVRRFLVGKPSFRASGMAGRGTRGYVALDCKTERFVWLKDAWRAHYELVDQEGTVLAQLNKAGVLNIPTLICHGDIRDQTTRTPELWELKNPPPTPLPIPSSSSDAPPKERPRPSSGTLKRKISEVEDVEDALPNGEPREECPLRRHKHYRVVVEEVCMPLVNFTSGRQLLEIVWACVVAHRDAMVDAKIVHRDISGGNILILPRIMPLPKSRKTAIKWSGVLVDWELSKPVEAKGVVPRARQPERTGTWQYMSVATLNNHSKVVETPDELESFLHVVLYYAVRYLRSNCVDAGNFIDSFFDSYSFVGGKYRCGDKKSNAIYSGTLPLDSTSQTNVLQFNSPLDGFLEALLKLFKAHYKVTEYDQARAANEKQAILPPSTSTVEPEEDDTPSLLHFMKRATSKPLRPAPRMKTDNNAPNDEQRMLAPQAQSHEYMLEALEVAILAPGDCKWPSGDRVKGDNVPSTFRPSRQVGPTPVASTAKRLRTNTSSTRTIPSDSTSTLPAADSTAGAHP